MARQPGQGEGIKSKLKSMLGLRKGGSVISVGHEEREADNLLLTSDILKDISKESSVIHRSKVLRELMEKVAVRKLEDHAVEALWHNIQDLLLPSTATEARHTALRFLTALAAGQHMRLGMLRAQFFRLIVSHDVKEDIAYRIDLLQVLTDNGKDISYCEQMGTFLVTFLPTALNGERAEDVLNFLINIVHYNSSFLEKETITSLVSLSCKHCNQARDEKEIKMVLDLLDAVVSYSGLPSDALHPLISTLCKTVNIESLCHSSWKLMKKLAGTRLGHSAMYIMCCILEDDANVSDISLLRGAVFFIGMCVWGSKRVPSLRHKPISLLPSVKRGLRCNHPIVARETGLSLHRLVKKYGRELEVVTWDLVLDITEDLLKFLEGLSSDQDSLRENVHDLITSIEELYTAGRYEGSTERFFAIIEKCAGYRPESSVVKLLQYIGESIHPMKEGWMDMLQNALEKYYRKEERSIIRVRALDMLSTIVASHRHWYEDEMIEGAVVPFLGSVFEEQDNSVRMVAAQLLVDLVVGCNSTRCADILTLIEKLINRFAENDSRATLCSTGDEYFQDVEVAVKGLIDAFKVKIFNQPIANAVRIYDILISHVTGHYVYGFVADAAMSTRKKIFEFLLNLRADSLHRLGLVDEQDAEGSLRHSVYVSCEASDIKEDGCTVESTQSTLEHAKLSFVQECPYYKAFDAILNALKDEWEWNVFTILLEYLPQQLQNKTLVIGGKGDVNTLCALLCKMVNDRMYLNKMRNIPAGVGRPEFLSMVFPILAVLATYCDWLDKSKQYDLIISMELGLNSQYGRTCVMCLTICTLEMRSAMMRVLPSILVKLSQISATVPMSIPVLEFLSCLKEVPSLYSNFVEEQYMSIFAIALPYTDAHKYNTHTVILAHHVITAWFTRCRLSFRRGFVKLITKGLKSSALTVAPPNGTKPKPEHLGRSPDQLEPTREFHEEMTEVCLDMMARYTFSTCATQPKRSPLVEFLLSNGISQTWLMGNMLVTITTSGKTNDSCPVCSDFGRKRDAAKRAAAKVRKLLAMGNVAQKDTERGALSRSRTISELRSTEEGGKNQDSIKRSRTIADYRAKEDGSNSQTTTLGTKEVKIASPKDTLYDKQFPRDKSASAHILVNNNAGPKATDASVDTSGAVDASTSISGVNISSVTDIVMSGSDPTSIPLSEKQALMSGENEGTSSSVPLVEKILLSPEGSYGSIFSPSRELLFSRQSSKTDIHDSSKRRSLPVGDTEETPDATDLVKSACGSHDTTNAKREEILSGAKTTPVVLLADDVMVASSSTCGNKQHQVFAEETQGDKGFKVKQQSDSLPLPKLTPNSFSNNENEKLGKSWTEVSYGVRQSRVDSEVSNKTEKLVAEYEIIDLSPSGDEQESVCSSEPYRPSLSETICNCVCEGWSEIMIRRPTGNISWITKIENRRLPEWNSNILADISGLAASLDFYEHSGSTDQSSDTIAQNKQSWGPPSTTDDGSKDGRSTRSSSGSMKPNEKEGSFPINVRRRRFSTGSIDIPGAFKFNMPSPDASLLLSKDDDLGVSLKSKNYFEKPSLGQSPLENFPYSIDCNGSKETFPGKPLDDPLDGKVTGAKGAIDILVDQHSRLQHESGKGLIHPSPKIPLRKSVSGSGFVASSFSKVLKDRPMEEGDKKGAYKRTGDGRQSCMENTLDVDSDSIKGKSQRQENTKIDQDEVKISSALQFSSRLTSTRPRGKTVSAISLKRLSAHMDAEGHLTEDNESWQGASNPHFVFLQLFYSPFSSCNTMYRPVLLESGEVIERAVKILDGIPSFDTHKIGVLYVGPDQENNERSILSNVYGYPRYADFVNGLGDLIKLSECSPTEVYTGGLDRHGNDGKFAFAWKDSSTQVIFHVATMMPNKPSDPSCHSKKLHIGNNFVTIVYNNSQKEYRFGTIKGQFNFAEILVEPMDYNSNIVTVRVKEELQGLVLNTGPHVISNSNLPGLVRQLAIHTNMMTVIHRKDKTPGLAYGCNWLERLRQIKRMRMRVTQDARQQGATLSLKPTVAVGRQSSGPCTDFTDYT